MTAITPIEKYCDYVDDVFVLGFKNEDDYFIIQYKKNSCNTEFHIELNGQGQSCYNGLKKVYTEANRIVFELNENGKKMLNTDCIVIIDSIRGNSACEKFLAEIEFINNNLPH